MGLFIKTKEELYAKGVDEHKKGNYQKAFTLFTKSADAGYADAWYMLGRLYEDGQGVQKNLEKAIEYYDKAASLGSVDGKDFANYHHAKIIGEKGFQYHKEQRWDESRAAWLEMIEKYDTPIAHFNLGIMYEDGLACEQSITEAKKCFQRAVEKGMTDAIPKMILHSETEEEKFHWMKKHAETGNAWGMLNVIEAYLFGNEGVEKNLDKANSWIEKIFAEVIDKYGEEIDDEEKWAVYVRYNYLYSVLSRQEGIYYDPEFAVEALQNSEDDPLCRFELAKMHYYGFDSIRADKHYGLKLIRKLAEENYEPADKFLEEHDPYRFYDRGKEALANGKTSLGYELIEKSANEGSIHAAIELTKQYKDSPAKLYMCCEQWADIYKDKYFMKECGDLANAGLDGQRYPDKAVTWYEKAYEARENILMVKKADICFELGKLYKEKEDYETALHWFEIVKTCGEKTTTRSAIGHISDLKKKMKISEE
ncbi:MAG: sel1 repeat family protein [Agathobacter sp.]|nr:sel1 repeat family protein [Agathobacter sp.]